MDVNRAEMRRLALRLGPVVLVLVGSVLIAATTGPSFAVGNLDAGCGTAGATCDVTVTLHNDGGAGSGVMSVNALTAHIEIGSSGKRSEKYGDSVTCSAAIPRTAHGDVSQVSCVLALPAGTPDGYYILQPSISASTS